MKRARNFVESLLKFGEILGELLRDAEGVEKSIAVRDRLGPAAPLANMPGEEAAVQRLAASAIMLRSLIRSHRCA